MTEFARRHAGWLLALLAVVLLLPGISEGLWDPWETHYAEVARRIVQDGDWVTLRWGSAESAPAEAREGFLFFSKPALSFWLMAVSFLIFGVTEAAARLPAVLLAAGAVAGSFYYLRRLVSFRAAVLGALAMLTAPLFAMLGHHAMTDMPLAAPMTVGTLAFAAVLLDPGTSRNHAYVGYLCFGAATLAKGLLGFLIPGAALLVLLLATANWSFLRDPYSAARHGIGCGAIGLVGLVAGYALGRRTGAGWGVATALVVCVGWLALAASEGRWRRLLLPTGVPLFLAVCATWYLPVLLEHGMVFVREFVLKHHLGRATTGAGVDLSGLDLHEGTSGYYIQQFGYALFPWIAVVPATLIGVLGRIRNAQADGRLLDGCHGDAVGSTPASAPPDHESRTENPAPLVVLLLAWAAVTYVAFTMSHVKFHHYVLPAIPPVAILAGIGLDHLWARGVGRVEAAALVFGGVLAFVVWRELADDPHRVIRLITYRYTRRLPEIGWMRVPLAAAMGLALAGIAAAVAGAVVSSRRRPTATSTSDSASAHERAAAQSARAGRIGAAVLVAAMSAAAVVVTVPVLRGAMPAVGRWISQKDAFAGFGIEPRREGDPLVSWANNWRGEVFYSRDRVHVIPPRDPAASGKLRALLRRPGRIFFITVDPAGLRREIEKILGAAARHRFRVITPERRVYALCLFDGVGEAGPSYDPRVETLPSDAAVPPGAAGGKPVAIFEPDGPGRLAIEGFRLGAPSVRLGGSIGIDLFFRCEARSLRDWEVFIHADAPAPARRPRVANGDHVFAGGVVRTDTCRPGEILLDRWDLGFPGGTPGSYEIFVGLWHPPTGDRMVVEPSTAAESPGAAGVPIDPEYLNRVYLGAVTLGP